MVAGVIDLGENHLALAAKHAGPVDCIHIHVAVQVEYLFEVGVHQGFDEGEHRGQEVFVYRPEELPIHQGKVQDSGAAGVDELHLHLQDALDHRTIHPVLDKENKVN